MNSRDSSSLDNRQNLPELTWKEHSQLFRQAIRSWHFYGIVFGISVLLMFTAGIVFQVVFIFSIVQGFAVLAMLNQSVYTAFLFVIKDKNLPRKLPKPPLSAFLASIIPLLISVFFLYVGIIAFQKTGFCSQSLGCMFVKLFQSIANGH